MEDYKKDGGGYTSAGRKLRPRKNAGAGASHAAPAYSTAGRRDDGSRPYGERKSYGRGYGEDRPRSCGERKPYGHNEDRPYGNRRSPGENRPYGENRSHGEGRSFDGNRRNYGEGRPYGENRSHGEGRRFDGNRRSYGESRPYGENRPHGEGKPRGNFRKNFKDGRRAPKRDMFTKVSDEGINRMINRRPQLDGQMPENAAAPAQNLESVRLNKFIANSGVCSRREADTMIQAGVVTVNGEVVTELGVKVNAYTDDVRFNGQRLKGEAKVYIVMNKPKGYVTTASDPHAEKTVMDLLKDCTARVYPVGRLDKATTGVLMFTNDGELAERLTHPSYDKKKIYQVILDKELAQEDCDRILSGVTLSDGDEKAGSLEYIDENDHRKLGIEIHSGKNRVVRRLFEAVGYEVRALDRVYFAGLTKRGLKKGEWRYLSKSEVNILRMGAYV